MTTSAVGARQTTAPVECYAGTLVRTGFVAVIAVAALARILTVGDAPMNAMEASQASAALTIAQGGRPEIWTDPVQALFTAAVFFLVGGSDAVARVLPVGAGIAVVALVWLAWEVPGLWIGTYESERARRLASVDNSAWPGLVAVIAAGLLALSALSVQASRHLGGEAVAAALAFALLLAWRRYQAGQSESGRRLLAILFVLTLLAGPAGFQSGLVLLAIVVLTGLARPESGAAMTLKSLFESRVTVLGWVLPAAATLLLVSSALLIYPGGVGIPSIFAWGERFAADSAPTPILYPLWIVLIYEPALFVLALLGVWATLRRKLFTASGGDGFARLLVAWAAAEVALDFLTTTRTSGSLVGALVPMALLGGIGGTWVIRQVWVLLVWRDGGAGAAKSHWGATAPLDWAGVAAALIPLAAAIGFTYTVLGFFSQPGGVFKEFAPAAILIALILVAGFLWTAVQRLGGAAVPVLAAAGIAVLVIAGIHATTSLNFHSYPELARPARGSVEIKLLTDRVVGVADRLRNKAVTIAIDSELRQPFGWYLRRLDGVSFVARPQPGPTIVVTRAASGSAGARPEAFSAYQRHVARLQDAPVEGIESLARWWRWLAFREGAPGEPDVVAYFSRA